MFSGRLQYKSSRRLQDMSSRHLQDFFSVTTFRPPRRLQDVLWYVLKTSSRRLENVLEDKRLLHCWPVKNVLKIFQCRIIANVNICTYLINNVNFYNLSIIICNFILFQTASIIFYFCFSTKKINSRLGL